MKVLARLEQWDLFDDFEVSMACNSLKVLANSGQVVSLILEKNMMKLLQIYDNLSDNAS